jgi:hypothetical protein
MRLLDAAASEPTRRTAGERIMNIRNVRSMFGGRGWLAVGLAAAMAMASGGALRANHGDNWKDIQGVWLIQVTLRSCSTGAPLGPAVGSVVTFHQGGTLSETTASPAFAPGQRTPGQGTWDRTGHRTYSQKMVSLIAFDTPPNLPITPGFFAGWAIVEHTVALTDEDHLSSSGTNAFYRTDGTVYRTGCSTATATRFE